MAEAEANPTEKETTRVRSIAFLCVRFLFSESLCVRAQSACLVMGHDEDRLLPHFRGVFVQNTLCVSMFKSSYDLLLHIDLLVLLLFLYDDTCII